MEEDLHEARERRRIIISQRKSKGDIRRRVSARRAGSRVAASARQIIIPCSALDRTSACESDAL